jgi:hypothetical protein
MAQNGDAKNPHFFLNVVISGGVDVSYLFDARPLRMTDAGKIQNYLYKNAGATPVLSDPTPRVMQGTNGRATLRSALTDDLAQFQDRFSVINGILMTTGNDFGHGQNMYQLFTNSTVGARESFMPYIGEVSGFPLQNIHLGGFEGDGNSAPSNFALAVHFPSPNAIQLGSAFLNQEKLSASGKLLNLVERRLGISAQTRPGLYGQGIKEFHAAHLKTPNLSAALEQTSVDEATGSKFHMSLKNALNFFKAGMSSSITLMMDMDPVIDVHSPGNAQDQRNLYTTIIKELTDLFTAMALPYSEEKGQSFLDVTTLMITSEFGRTTRNPSSPIDNTDTDHNPFINSVILAGRGIKTGQIIGASDLEDVDAAGEIINVSGAHLQKDKSLVYTMGKPFDFAMGDAVDSLPEQFRAEDYLTIGSVNNTMMNLFGVPEQRYHRDASGQRSRLLKNILV